MVYFHRASPGKRLPLGSNFPVEGINPLLGFYAAVAQCSPDGMSPHGPVGGACLSFPSFRLPYIITILHLRNSALCTLILVTREHMRPVQMLILITAPSLHMLIMGLYYTQVPRGGADAHAGSMGRNTAYTAFAEDMHGQLASGSQSSCWGLALVSVPSLHLHAIDDMAISIV